MKLVSFTIPDSLAGQRLMTVIRRMAPNVAEYAIRDALHKRDVKLDHVRADRNIPVFGVELEVAGHGHHRDAEHLQPLRILRGLCIRY